MNCKAGHAVVAKVVFAAAVTSLASLSEGCSRLRKQLAGTLYQESNAQGRC